MFATGGLFTCFRSFLDLGVCVPQRLFLRESGGDEMAWKAVKAVCWKHFGVLYDLFDYYATIGDGDCFSIQASACVTVPLASSVCMCVSFLTCVRACVCGFTPAR